LEQSDDTPEVILGNSNKRFSGVTSTMLQTLACQRELVNVRVLGSHHLPPESAALAISFFALARLCRKTLPDGRWRVFHARRNDEMIQALLLKHVFGAKIRILFTSTAQRHHSRFSKFLMSKMDKVISTCSAAAKYLNPPPSDIVPHGINTRLYSPVEKNNDSIEIGIFGRVRAQKGTDLFVRAAISALKERADVQATIVGAITPEQRPFAETLKAEIKAAGLEDRIRFTGELPFEQIPALFQRMHLVAALSLNEGYGLTVLEAMSSGAAVLTSEAGAWPDIVEPGVHGEIVTCNNQQEANAALAKLLTDKHTLIEMGQAARRHILKNYTIEREAERLCNIYKDMSGEPNDPLRHRL